MNIDLKEFNELLNKLAEVETVELEDLHLFLDGVEIDKDNSMGINVEDFKFTGLMNRDFISMLLNEILIS